MAAPILQIKRGNAGIAGTIPALRAGEPGFSLNNFDLFVGFNSTVSGNKFFGSHRYWGREDGTSALKLKLVDKNGINGIHLKSPDTVSGIGTYTLPDTNTIINGYYLKVSANGTLSWSNTNSTNGIFTSPTLTGNTIINESLINNSNTINSGITTFSNTTDNVLGNSNTGSIEIDGGVGIDKNLTIGGNLNVQGYTKFVGVVTAANDLSVYGNLYVNGTSTELNTSTLTIEDRTIELGVINGAAPASTTTWDLGILFNYFQTTAKKSALIWEQTDSRFKFASVLNSDTEGSDANTPQLTVTTFAPIEIAELWVNNTCTGGPQQVIGCIGAELSLQNINIDSGYY